MADALSAMRSKVWLFALKHLLSAQESLSLNVVREICSYLTDGEGLVQVTSAFLSPLLVCLPALLQLPPLLGDLQCATEIRANESSAWVLLENGRVFCSGRKWQSG